MQGNFKASKRYRIVPCADAAIGAFLMSFHLWFSHQQAALMPPDGVRLRLQHQRVLYFSLSLSHLIILCVDVSAATNQKSRNINVAAVARVVERGDTPAPVTAAIVDPGPVIQEVCYDVRVSVVGRFVEGKPAAVITGVDRVALEKIIEQELK